MTKWLSKSNTIWLIFCSFSYAQNACYILVNVIIIIIKSLLLKLYFTSEQIGVFTRLQQCIAIVAYIYINIYDNCALNYFVQKIDLLLHFTLELIYAIILICLVYSLSFSLWRVLHFIKLFMVIKWFEILLRLTFILEIL